MLIKIIQKPNISWIFFILLDAILLAFSYPSKSIESKNLCSVNNLLISCDIGKIFSTKTCDNFSLNSEKFFPENSLMDFSNVNPAKLE